MAGFVRPTNGDIMRFAQEAAHQVWTLLFGDGHPILGDGKGKAKARGSRPDTSTGMGTEFGQDVANVVTDRFRREVKPLRDGVITAVDSDERRDFQFGVPWDHHTAAGGR